MPEELKPSPAAVVYIAKNIFSEVDAILPLLVELSARNILVDAIFFERRSYDEVATSPMHLRLLNSCTRVWRLFGEGSGVAARLISVVRFIHLVAKHRLAKRRLLFLHNATGSRKKGLNRNQLWLKLLRAVMALSGGRVFAYPGIQAPATELFLRRENPAELAKRVKLEKITGEMSSAPDEALVFTPLQKRGMRENRHWGCPIHVIGLPRLYPRWRAAVNTEGRKDIEDELVRCGLPGNTREILTVLLTYPHFQWFRPERNFYTLLDEAIEALRVAFPDTPIFLKAKPRYKEHNFFGEDNIRRREGVYLTACSLAALATRSRLGLSIHETSGVFDFMTQGVPAIEYADYAPAWTEIFPVPSPWTGLPGFRLTQSVNELNQALADVRDKTFIGDPVALADAIGHRENLDIFTR